MTTDRTRRCCNGLRHIRAAPDAVPFAQARAAAMVEQGGEPRDRLPPASIEEITRGVAACRHCPIGCNGTRAAAGEGPATARLLIVGEQPGK